MGGVFGWDGVNRDGLRGQQRRAKPPRKGCGKKATALVIGFTVSALAIGNAVGNSLLG